MTGLIALLSLATVAGAVSLSSARVRPSLPGYASYVSGTIDGGGALAGTPVRTGALLSVGGLAAVWTALGATVSVVDLALRRQQRQGHAAGAVLGRRARRRGGARRG